MILNFVHLHIQHIVMNAKVSYGVLQGKVLNVENVELNAMKNAKIFSMLIVYNVSSNLCLLIVFLLFVWPILYCSSIVILHVWLCWRFRWGDKYAAVRKFIHLTCLFFFKIIPIIMLITSHASFIYHIKEDFDLNNSFSFFCR